MGGSGAGKESEAGRDSTPTVLRVVEGGEGAGALPARHKKTP